MCEPQPLATLRASTGKTLLYLNNKHYAMQTYGGVEVYTHVFSALVGGEWSASRTCRFTPRYPVGRRLRGPQNRSGRRRKEKNLGHTGTRTPTPWPTKPISIRYTDCATRLPHLHLVPRLNMHGAVSPIPHRLNGILLIIKYKEQYLTLLS
jgi:hypothetical protein